MLEKYHILVIDDDVKIASLLQRYLESQGYIVSLAFSTSEAEKILEILIFDLLIIDCMLPIENGPSFLKRRTDLCMPKIMLSALGEVEDRIDGLESGADDYIAKPFAPKELLLRMQKLLKTRATIHQVKFGSFIFNKKNHTLYMNDQLIALTTAEKHILQILSDTPGKIVSKQNISSIDNSLSRAIDTQIARLRSKIEVNPKQPSFLHTVRNKGYVLYCDII